MTRWSQLAAMRKPLPMKTLKVETSSVDQDVGVTGGAATEMAATGMPMKVKHLLKRVRRRPSAKQLWQRLPQQSSKFFPSRLKRGNGNRLPPQ